MDRRSENSPDQTILGGPRGLAIERMEKTSLDPPSAETGMVIVEPAVPPASAIDSTTGA